MVANTSFMFWEASFSLRRSPRIVGAKLAPWTAPWLASPAFVVCSTYSLPSEEMLTVGGALVGLPWASAASEDAGLALESEELTRHMAGG